MTVKGLKKCTVHLMACSGSCAVNFVPATQRHVKATLKVHHSIVLSLHTHTHTPTCHMSTRKPRPQPLRSRPPTWWIEYHVHLSLHHSTTYFIQKSLTAALFKLKPLVHADLTAQIVSMIPKPSSVS